MSSIFERVEILIEKKFKNKIKSCQMPIISINDILLISTLITRKFDIKRELIYTLGY